jgi:predicted dehydrogenase
MKIGNVIGFGLKTEYCEWLKKQPLECYTICMKTRAALIGLGTNAANYRDGLLLSQSIELSVVCDLDSSAISRKYYEKTPFVNDYRTIPNLFDVDVVFVVTPPKTHFEIGSFFVKRGIPVVLEKPPFEKYSDLFRFNAVSFPGHAMWMTAYHWQYGPDIEYLKKEMPKLGKIVSATTTIFDPYFEHGHILPNKVNLLGAWLDSGSNALSVFAYLFEGLRPNLIHRHFEMDSKVGMPFYSNVVFGGADNAIFSIEIDWTKHINLKRSVYEFENASIAIEHSAQSVYENGKLVASFHDRPRLVNHYFHMLNNFSSRELIDRQMSDSVLKFMYEVNEDGKNNSSNKIGF